MSKLRTLSQVDSATWNALVEASGGTIFHAAEWASYSKAVQPNAVPRFYSLVEDDGSISGNALGFHSASSRLVAASFSGQCWLDALPAMRDRSSAGAATFLALIEDHARRAGDVELRVGSFASPGAEEILKPLGFSVAPRFEFELDITQPEKALWDGMDYKRRKNIKKAMKCGVQIQEMPPEEGVAHLRRLQEASFVRVTARGGPALIQPESSAGDPILALTSAGVGRLVGGFVDGVCVTASFFTTFNRLAYHTLSGHDGKALETQAPTLLLWEMFLRLQKEGIERLNFGGCSAGAVEETSPEHGVYTYKKAFGGARLDCANGEKTLRPAVQRIRNVLKGVLR
jgi:hypothetical protein